MKVSAGEETRTAAVNREAGAGPQQAVSDSVESRLNRIVTLERTGRHAEALRSFNDLLRDHVTPGDLMEIRRFLKETGENKEFRRSGNFTDYRNAFQKVYPSSSGRRSRRRKKIRARVPKMSGPLYMWLTVILVGGCMLRFYGLDYQSLWNDELSSWARSNFDNLRTVFRVGVRPDVHPPGYQFMLYYVIRYLGDGESVLRLPSAIAGVLSIFAIFLLGRKLYSPREGIIAAALLAVSRVPVYYSQEARSYSFLMLFTLFAVYFGVSLVHEIETKGKRINLFSAGYVVSAALSLYFHYYGIFITGLLAVALFGYFQGNRRGLKRIALVHAYILFLYFPWLPYLLEDLHIGGFWIPEPGPRAVYEYFLFLFNGSGFFLAAFIAPLYVFLAARSCYDLMNNKKRGKTFREIFFSPGLMLFFWLIVPFAVVYLKSILSTPILTNRNLIISLPAAYLLAARAVSRLPVSDGKRYALAGGAALYVLYLLFFQAHYYSTPQKQQFREAAQYLALHDGFYKGSPVIAYTPNKSFFNYYFKRLNSPRRVDLMLGAADDIKKLQSFIRQNDPEFIWYITGHLWPEKDFLEFMRKSFTIVEERYYEAASVMLFKVRQKRVDYGGHLSPREGLTD